MPRIILVVDDDPISRVFNATGLRAGGFDALEASDGLTALNLLQQNDVEALLCDLRMPDMDGIELVKAVRAQSRYQAMPVVMLSAERSTEVVDRGTSAGVAVWLQKPVSRSHLIATLTGLFQKQA